MANNHEMVTVGNTVVRLTAGRYKDNKRAIITVEGSFRYWLDGQNPTTALGHLASDGQVIKLESKDEMTKFRAIRDQAADATIQVSYYNQHGEPQGW